MPGSAQVGVSTQELLGLGQDVPQRRHIDCVQAGRLLEWPANDRHKQLQGSHLVAPAGWMGCRVIEVVEGRLLDMLWPLGRWWPGYSGGSVVPTCVAFTSCWRHQPPADQP